MRISFGKPITVAVAIVAIGVLASCSKDNSATSTTLPGASATTAAPSSTVAQPTTGQVTSKDGITRTILGVVDPPNASGQTLYLQPPFSRIIVCRGQFGSYAWLLPNLSHLSSTSMETPPAADTGPSE